MSIQFSNTTLKNGIIQFIEKNCGFNDGDVSGNPTLLAQFTADINVALDRIWAVIIQAMGTWSLDDTNYTDYPFIYQNLVSGQRDYPFVTDGAGNLILEVQRVMVADASGVWHEIYAVDQKTTTKLTDSQTRTDNFINGLNTTGVPKRYDKTGNAFFLDPIPNYNMANGLKVFIDREASYFVFGDTVKKPGFAGIFHEYLALRPSYQYCARNSLDNAKDLFNQMTAMERACQEYYSKRQKDQRNAMVPNVVNNK